MSVTAIIAAGGRGTRMGADINKVFLPLLGRELLSYTLAAFEDCDDIDDIVVVTGADDTALVGKLAKKYNIDKLSAVIAGGSERSGSVYNGLCAAKGTFAAIHDGARCLITPAEISAVIHDAERFGASALGIKVKDTLKSIDESGQITGTVDRERTVYIQTPQVFLLDEILILHKRAAEDGLSFTDDCAVLEHYGRSVHVTPGSYENIKLTTPEDMTVGAEILKRRLLI